MNVILTGMRGTGKSSIGRILATLLGFTFVDTDLMLEACARRPIADIVAEHGWPHFRALERQVVSRVATSDHHVVATGGGTLIDETNAKLLKPSGVVVLLVCDIPTLQRRISRQGNRPSLTGQASATAELAQIWEERRRRYTEVADVTYDVSTESSDHLFDLQRKARAIYELLPHPGQVSQEP